MKGMRTENDYIAVVGLGYVGLPLAVAFADKVKTLGFDTNRDKINIYKKGIDPTREIGDEKIQSTTLEFVTDPTRLKEAKVIIVAVPTPINGDKTPDVDPYYCLSSGDAWYTRRLLLPVEKSITNGDILLTL